MKTLPFVLVCDDNRASADCIVFYLRKAGYRAQAVDSPQDCAAVARRSRPDLILWDGKIPGIEEAVAPSELDTVTGIEGIPVVRLSGDLMTRSAS